jgi:hypothetical protein
MRPGAVVDAPFWRRAWAARDLAVSTQNMTSEQTIIARTSDCWVVAVRQRQPARCRASDRSSYRCKERWQTGITEISRKKAVL